MLSFCLTSEVLGAYSIYKVGRPIPTYVILKQMICDIRRRNCCTIKKYVKYIKYYSRYTFLIYKSNNNCYLVWCGSGIEYYRHEKHENLIPIKFTLDIKRLTGNRLNLGYSHLEALDIITSGSSRRLQIRYLQYYLKNRSLSLYLYFHL